MRIRFALFSAAFLLLNALSFAGDAPQSDPLSADPQQVAAATRAITAPEGMPVVLALEEYKISFDADGRKSYSRHLVYRILTTAGAKGWAEVSSRWAPWHQQKPALYARVIASDGTVHALDQATITDSPAKDSDNDIFGNDRVVRAPLPAVAPGSVIEEQVEVKDTQPYFSAGQVTRIWIGRAVPVQKIRVTVEYSNKIPLKYVTRLLPGLVAEKSTGPETTTLTFEQGAMEAIRNIEADLPGDIPSWPRIEFSTGKSWRELAESYSRIVEEKVTPPAELKAAVQQVSGKGGKLETISAINELLHKQVRYTGVEFSEAALIPGTPEATLKRKYGDCKDKSALLVSMLRAAGIEAHLALLSAGSGEDVEAELPGMGTFNHAIVYIPGSPAIWIDATAEYNRAGVLPNADQGRLALVAAPGVDALQRIPESNSIVNHIVETREFILAELGKAKVIETSENAGNADANLRAYYGDAIGKDRRKELEDYVKNSYLAEELSGVEHGDGKDFSKPFQLRLVADKVGRGVSDENEAAVGILPVGLLGRLPRYLRQIEDDTNKSQEEKEEKRRKHDLLLPEAFVAEWHYRIALPSGFQAQPLPEPSVRKIGPMQIESRYGIGKDGVVTADFQFDTGKRRLTAAEVEQFKADYKQLAQAPAVLLHFDQVGHSYLAKGKVREALAEYRRLEQLHPKEALHHSQIARALLAAGIGSEARKEAEAAVALEPTAPAYYTLAQIREHDLIGRVVEKGYDHAGAEAALRKAHELKPDDLDYTLQLALLMEYNDDGARYAKGANLEESARLYRSVLEKARNTTYADNLPLALFWADKYSDALAELDQLAPAQNRYALRLASVALMKGPPAALHEAERVSSDGGLRAKSLVDAGSLLIKKRHYAEASELLAVAASSVENSAQLSGYAQVLAKTRRHEDLIAEAKGPLQPVLRFRSIFAGGGIDPDAVFGMFSGPVLPPASSRERQSKGLHNTAYAVAKSLEKEGLTPASSTDIDLSISESVIEGSEESGYRVHIQTPGQDPQNFLVAREGTAYKLVEAAGQSDDVGLYVLARAEAGDKVEHLRQWLDWVREETPLVSGDDPLAGAIFPRFWAKGQKGDLNAVRYAAAALASGSENAERVVATLREGQAKATTEAEQANFDLALASALLQAHKYAEAGAPARRLVEKFPESKEAFQLYIRALWASRQYAGWRAAVDARLKRLPEDEDAVRSLVMLQEVQGDFAGGRTTSKRLAAKGKAASEDYNGAAWSTLFDGSTDAGAVEAIERSNMMAKQGSAGILHTLAAVYAEVGKTAEARDALLRAMDIWGYQEPDANCWYVFGRLAEAYGIDAAAIEYYGKAEKPENDIGIELSSYALAQKHMKALQAKQGHPAAQVAAK